MKPGKQLRWSLLVFLFLVFIGCLPAEAVNPFADEKVTIQQGSSLDSGEILFNKPQLDKKATDDSLKNASIAVMSDLHARNWNHASLIAAFKAINGLKDVSALVLTGDSVEKIGSPNEYSFLLKTLNTLKKPVMAVTGNHDIMYKDYYNPDKNAKNPKLRTTPAERKAKLERFRKLLKLKATRYTKKIGGHLLVFLPNDDLDAK
ncbi:MAG TPA: metallophosphoesterase family protein, partial [Candidatus Rifleibacterium sp.]|nr:metallophosphoesterase family protein [Candidatus Rifleibacterium sp.]